MRECSECGRSFKPSSRHRECPACRARAARKTCGCGELMHRDAAMCRTCSTAAGVWRGENSPVWKGGRTRLKNGYVMVQAFGHPRTTRYTNYVFEHILVMEEALGRYLDMDETVHHLNGVKEDNRVENLELWTKPQPSGIRATDAIAWAWAILSKYEGWEPFGPGPA